jgi:putative acetyltransferase
MTTITQAASDPELLLVRELFREYAADSAIDLCFQNFEEELAGLPGAYSPPSGRLFLAHSDGQLAACGALRPFAEGVCEMKRLFVRPAFRGRGIGRALAERLIAEARTIGYHAMRLDTLGAHEAGNCALRGAGIPANRRLPTQSAGGCGVYGAGPVADEFPARVPVFPVAGPSCAREFGARGLHLNRLPRRNRAAG